jgi:hypothetical protein
VEVELGLYDLDEILSRSCSSKKRKEFITRLAIFHFIPLESKKEKERRKNKAFFSSKMIQISLDVCILLNLDI